MSVAASPDRLSASAIVSSRLEKQNLTFVRPREARAVEAAARHRRHAD
jgi:hypothetical protein